MELDAQAGIAATIAVPGMPRDQNGPVFREPWEAQAFAIAVALHARGVFTWTEWAAALAVQIKRAQSAGDADTGETYYRHWLATLEHLVAEKGVTTVATLHRYRDAWDHAADRTPHGSPIELRLEDFRLAVELRLVSDPSDTISTTEAARNGRGDIRGIAKSWEFNE